MARIIFDDKEATKTSTKPRKNLITYEDINELKNSVNALYDFVEIADNEVKIGKYGNDDLFRRKIEIPYNNIPANNTIDLSSLGFKEVFVNFTYSYFYDYVSQGNKHIHYPLIALYMTDQAKITDIRENSGLILQNDNTQIKFYIAPDFTFRKLVLTLEYTKE